MNINHLTLKRLSHQSQPMEPEVLPRYKIGQTVFIVGFRHKNYGLELTEWYIRQCCIISIDQSFTPGFDIFGNVKEIEYDILEDSRGVNLTYSERRLYASRHEAAIEIKRLISSNMESLQKMHVPV